MQYSISHDELKFPTFVSIIFMSQAKYYFIAEKTKDRHSFTVFTLKKKIRNKETYEWEVFIETHDKNINKLQFNFRSKFSE